MSEQGFDNYGEAWEMEQNMFYDPANAFLYASRVRYAKVYIVNHRCCSFGAMTGRQEVTLLDESRPSDASL